MDDRSNVLVRAAGDGNRPRYSVPALASFVCAAIAMAGLLLSQFITGLVYLVLFFAPAIVMGHVARRQFRRAPGVFRNESMATFGLSVGYLCLFLNAFVIAAIFWLASR